MATCAGCRGWCALENEIPGASRGITVRRRNSSKSAALEIRAVMEDGGPFSIAEWAAQATPAPKVEPKDDAPASKVELIDLTDDVDSPRRDGSNATTEGGRVDDGATTDGLRRVAAAAPSTAGETSAATPAPIETPPPVDAALADLVKFAKLYAPRARVPDPNSERFASARRAASRADKVRHPTPVSGDAWGAKLPVTNPADGVVVPGAFDGKAFAPGQTPVVTAVFTAATKPRGVLGAYDVVAIEGVSPRAGFEPGHETDGEDDVSTDRHRTAINPLANGVDLRDSRCSHRQLCALAAESVSTRLSTHPTPASPTAFGGPLPERPRAMIPLVRAMLPGDATTDASILTARASDDHRRQAQVTARMEKRFGTGAFTKDARGRVTIRGGRGRGGRGRGRGRLRMAPVGDVAEGGGRDRKRRRETAAGGVGGGGEGDDAELIPNPVVDLTLSDGEDEDAEDDDGDGDELGDEDEDEDDFIDDEDDDEENEGDFDDGDDDDYSDVNF